MYKSIPAFYDKQYAEGPEIWRTSKQYTVDCVPDGERLEILDVGCGTGANSVALAAKGHSVRGVDVSETAIAHYRTRGFDGRVTDLEVGLDYPDASFDLVFCSEVIEHIVSPETLVSEMGRLLKPGGRIVLSTPNSAFWLYRLLGLLGYTVSELQHPKHFQFFSRRSLIGLFARHGLSVDRALGRNMYLILPNPPKQLAAVLAGLGFKQETRFRTGRSFWHLSAKSSRLNTLFADTLILVLKRGG
jgi:SAM-dependent methyltransferase